MRLSNKKPRKSILTRRRCTDKYIFFHPDCTVGLGITPNQRELVDFDHRWGLAPRLEDSDSFV